MRRTLVAAGAFGLLLGSAAVASAHNRDDWNGQHRQDDRVVVVSGLGNPRQLSWVGRNLLVAEAGSGGSNGTACTAASSTATTTTSTTDTTIPTTTASTTDTTTTAPTTTTTAPTTT